MSTQSAASGLLVTSDLIFSTKIVGTARALGLEMQVLGSAHGAAGRLVEQPAACVILDLGLPNLSVDQIRAIVSAAASSPVVAFGSHVDAAQLQSARDAGCADVLPRSRFATTLPQLLQQYLAPDRHAIDARDQRGQGGASAASDS